MTVRTGYAVSYTHLDVYKRQLFFPFDTLDVIKRGIESMWNIQNDRVMMALALTMTDKPMAEMCIRDRVWPLH